MNLIFSLFPGVAKAAMDTDLSSLVSTSSATIKDDVLGVLGIGFPIIVAVGISFWGLFWVYRHLVRH